jgi:predicted  nucleic acid-binding Zn-ribbon protein
MQIDELKSLLCKVQEEVSSLRAKSETDTTSLKSAVDEKTDLAVRLMHLELEKQDLQNQIGLQKETMKSAEISKVVKMFLDFLFGWIPEHDMRIY